MCVYPCVRSVKGQKEIPNKRFVDSNNNNIHNNIYSNKSNDELQKKSFENNTHIYIYISLLLFTLIYLSGFTLNHSYFE